MRFYTLAVLTYGLLFTSCHDEKKEKDLQTRIAQLEAELDECKNGEDKLIGIIRNAFSSKDYVSASSTYTQLINKFPGTKFKEEAQEIFHKSNDLIKKQQEEAQRKKEAEEAIKRASLTKLKRKFDDIKNINWYSQRYFTHYTNSNRSSLYVGHTKGSEPNLRLQMSYMGDDWIFFEKAYLSYDGNTKEIYFDDYREKQSDNGDGDVWEWIDVAIESSDVDWLKKFASSPNAKMRLTGKYEKTRNLTSQERQGFLDIISGYEYLKENNK